VYGNVIIAMYMKQSYTKGNIELQPYILHGGFCTKCLFVAKGPLLLLHSIPYLNISQVLLAATDEF